MKRVFLGIAAFLLAGTPANATTKTADDLFCVNAMVRSAIALNGVDPAYATRVYALNSILQHEVYRELTQQFGNTEKATTRRLFAVAAARAAYRLIFLELGPGAASVETMEWNACGTEANPDEDQSAAGTLGRTAADTLLNKRGQDGSREGSPVQLPADLSMWQSFQNRPPIRPMWGDVRPLMVNDIEAHVAPAPPSLESSRFQEELAIVQKEANQRTAVSQALVQKWADPTGTATPAGHWLLIAEEEISYLPEDELKLRALAVIAIAMHDAAIACWRTKFRYWYPRPSQVTRDLRPSISVPNFPAYTSGHSTISGAAMTALSHFIPHRSNEFERLAAEASYSRILAGIHYPADAAAGLAQGISVSQVVLRSIAPGRSIAAQIR